MLGSVGSMLERIFQGRSREVSYEESYHTLYCLFKNDKGNLIEGATLEKLRALFRSELQSVNPEAAFLEELTRRTALMLSYIEKMMKVYFFLEANYFEPERKASLRHIAYAVLKEELMADERVFHRFVNEVVELAFVVKDDLHKDHGLLRDAMEAIFKLDSAPGTPDVFGAYVRPRYVSAMKNLYRRRVDEFRGERLDELIESMLELHQREKVFLGEYFANRRNEAALAQILKEGYASWVTANRVALFKSAAIDNLLDRNLKLLFRVAKMDELTLREFANLFIYKVKAKLDRLDHTSCLIRQFSELYGRTVADIQDFDQGLSSRVKLTFEVWLNKEPQAISSLNYFIGELLDSMNENKENRQPKALGEFLVIFKFIKDKDEFEKGYRKLLLERLTAGRSVLESELRIVGLMKEECGSNWTASIEGLLEEGRASAPATWVFWEGNWPHNEDPKVVLAPEMLELKRPFEKEYCRKYPSRLLRWHHLLGDGRVSVRGNRGVFALQLTTPMLHLLLEFNRQGLVVLGQFVRRCHVDLQQTRKHVFALVQSGVVQAGKPVGSAGQLTEETVLSLNLDFEPGSGELVLRPYSESRSLELVKKEELSVDRKVMVDSVIIRQMKLRKTCPEKELLEKVSEVIEQKGFSPNAEFIGNCLRELVERDFMRHGEAGELIYIP